MHGKDPLTAAEFKRQSKKLWKSRTNGKTKQAQAIRGLSYNSAIEDVERRKGESKQQHRVRILPAAALFQVAIRRTFDRASPEDQEDMLKTAERWAEEALKEAADPSYVCSLSSQPTSIPLADD